MNKDQKLQIVGGGKAAWDEELRLWLAGYIEEHPHHAPAVLARREYIGMSRTAIDAYLKCEYFDRGDGAGGVKSSRLEDLIRAYRERIGAATRDDGLSRKFIKTTAWTQFQNACKTAIEESAIVVAYAKPGDGKSRCMAEFSISKMQTAPITILCSPNITTRYFVQKIARALNLNDRPVTAHLEDNVAEKLRTTRRPLFIDQANYLNEKGLGAVCYIWEVSRIPIVLIGTKDLYDLFTSSDMTQDVRAQLSSRVAMHYPLDGLDLAQVKAIVERSLGKAATADAVRAVYNAVGGTAEHATANYRSLEFLLRRVTKMVKLNADKIDRGELSIEQIISTAGSRLMVA